MPWANAPSAALAKQVEIDFGATGINTKIFTISDADVKATSFIIPVTSSSAPTGKDADELEMDELTYNVTPQSGQFLLRVEAVEGNIVADKFKVNYLINN